MILRSSGCKHRWSNSAHRSWRGDGRLLTRCSLSLRRRLPCGSVNMETMVFEGETMKPNVICHMIASLDGSLHPSRCTTSPDGSRAEWSEIYEEVHRAFEADAWLVGRVTMAEMSKAGPHAPTQYSAVERPYHFARRGPGPYAV